MKKLPRLQPNGRMVALAALLCMMLGQTACKKSEGQPQLKETKAWLNLANPATDGSPVDVLFLDSTHETVVPINRKDGWPQTQAGPTAVGVRYVETGRDFTRVIDGRLLRWHEVYLISFRVL